MNKGDVCFQHDKYMIEDKLISQWGIWFIYKGESYEGNVHLITILSSLADLAYFWLHSPIASLSNFFLSEDNRQKTYLIGESFRKINSIQFFKKGIEPKWEDEQNQKGGRFIFQVLKSEPNKQQIYQKLTFFILGADFKGSDQINGFRFVSSKPNNPSSFRVQIWVNFDESDTESITVFQDILTDLFNQIEFKPDEKIQFKQMKNQGVKDPKDKEAKPDDKDKGKDK